MPTLTRSQARSGRPPDLVTSSRVNRPRRLVESRQTSMLVEVINDVNGEGSPPVVVAGNQSVASYTMAKCNKALCKTCPFFLHQNQFYLM